MSGDHPRASARGEEQSVQIERRSDVEGAVDRIEYRGVGFFVVAFGLRQIVQYDRYDTRSPRARTAPLGFMPDNIHWDGDRLLAAGMVHDELLAAACGASSMGSPTRCVA